MSGAPTPQFIPSPFAVGSGQINYPIPATPPGSPANSASWSQGFPAITMQTEVSGGKPPLGPDFNGILYTITQHIYALQAGQLDPYDSSFAAIISGYNLGALLAMADGSGCWLNGSGGNTTNPDDDGSSVGWLPGICYGLGQVTGLTGGTVIVPQSKSKKPILQLAGALTSNLNLILPNTLQQWLIVNGCTGAFTVTVKTAAGTGVVIPAGGFAQPTGVYGNGTNIYPTQSPLSVPISIPNVPSTLVERDNTGQAFIQRLNQASSPTENPSIGAIAVMSTALDGFLRWDSLANFVTQFFAQNPSQSKTATGWVTLPGGIIINFGYTQGAASGAFLSPGPIAVTFGKQFPTSFLIGGCWTKRSTPGSSGSNFIAASPAPTKNGMTCIFDALDGASNITNGGYWIAIGF